MIKFSAVRFVHWCILFTLLFNGFGVSSIAKSSPIANIQPLLRQLADEAPTQTVAVIVQKADQSDEAERLIIRLGGRITQNLQIIHAFAADLPAGAVQEVAANPTVRWISLDESVKTSGCETCISTLNLLNDYIGTIHADALWNQAKTLQGQGIAVAVVDSGIKSTHPDLAGRIVAQTNFSRTLTTDDFFGHGTYVAGIIAGNGTASDGAYIGVAPKANLVNVKVTNLFGAARESDVIAGLQWVYENRKTYNIRVVNLSINSATAQSYQTSPLAAACEILWFNGVVVVVSSGNKGEGTLYPPANDPFVITVGATDDDDSREIDDDQVADFSAFGRTSDGFNKPDLVVPGRHLIAPFPGKYSYFALAHPDNIVNGSYFLMSGTSAAAPVVSGAVALLLQDEPNLTPDQVKYRLMATANKNWGGYSQAKAGAGILDIRAAVNGTTSKSANTGINVSNLLTTGPEGVLSPTVSWNSVSWNSVSWNSVSWNSVSWNSVSWNSVSWNSDYWEDGSSLSDFKISRSLPVDFGDETEEQQAGTKNVVYMPLITR